MRDQYMRSGQGFVLVYRLVAPVLSLCPFFFFFFFLADRLGVRSITSMSTFNDIADLRNQICRVKDSDNVPILIAGNKCDLENERAVPTEKGKNLAAQFKCPFLEASAKSRINVNEVFFELVRQVNKAAPKEAGGGKKKGGCTL